MAQRKKFHEQLRENLEAQQEGKEPPTPSDDEEARKKKADLDNARRQAEIMDPSGTEVEFSFGKIRLYPYTMFDQATAKGFCDGILADVFGVGARNQFEAAYRLSSVVLKSVATKRELLGLLAIATEKPGVIDSSERGQPIAADLAHKFTPDDYVKAFNEIQERASVKNAKKA